MCEERLFFLYETGFMLLMASYYVLYRELPNKQPQVLSYRTSTKKRHLMRFAPERQTYLAICILARSIIGGILIDAYIDWAIEWLFIIASIAVCLHPYFNHFFTEDDSSSTYQNSYY